MSIINTINELQEDLELFETPNEKLDFIMDMAKNFVPLEDEHKIDANLINGCSSRAWMIFDCSGDKIHYRVDGESLMAKGMITVLLKIFDNRTPKEILDFDPQLLNGLHFEKLLSPVRLQGLDAFLKYLKSYAKICLEKKDG